MAPMAGDLRCNLVTGKSREEPERVGTDGEADAAKFPERPAPVRCGPFPGPTVDVSHHLIADCGVPPGFARRGIRGWPQRRRKMPSRLFSIRVVKDGVRPGREQTPEDFAEFAASLSSPAGQAIAVDGGIRLK